MVKRMLIDATHAEETRVVVLDGNRLEEFDFETSSKKQIKGNIYLAKVTRVEPSLQAAFVEYGGNRHGFLAFNEIHPDYYRIPQADRDALMRETLEQQRYEEMASPLVREQEPQNEISNESGYVDLQNIGAEDGNDADPTIAQAELLHDSALIEDGLVETVEVLGGDDFEDVPPRRRPYRNYKIQEVIARRQIVLVQVVKEERGNKGAALTTYLSLAGRYCVLMPNTPRGGGISRKITSLADRKRLKSILDDLEIPDGVAVIMRTAGLDRPRTDIHRDYEYLLRLWNEIRETTLASSAPTLIHEEGNLIKRAIRDLYSRDIDEIWVDGEEGYRTAKSFMRAIIPSRIKRVLAYRDPAIPLLNRFQVEAQLDAIHNPVMHLRSGGYIVINLTEALVAIDVNSGRATKERHIEETALKTNLEAAEEIARQVRLRDLAGLIVIDFIDMEENRNNHAVERRLKEAMKNDRARIQIGRISPFGLLELSRQRLRTSLVEASTQKCPHCNGSGVIRSTESASLHVLRAIEDEGIRGRTLELLVFVPTSIALYILNQKRDKLIDIERRYSFTVQIDCDDSLIQPDHRIERLRMRPPGEQPSFMTAAPPPAPDEPQEDEAQEQEETMSDAAYDSDRDKDQPAKRKRRRRRRRRDGAPMLEGEVPLQDGVLLDKEEGVESVEIPWQEETLEEKSEEKLALSPSSESPSSDAISPLFDGGVALSEEASPVPLEKPKKAKRVASRKKKTDSSESDNAQAVQSQETVQEETPKPKKRSPSRRKSAKTEPIVESLPSEPLESSLLQSSSPGPSLPAVTVTVVEEPPPRRRAGWWQRN